MNEELILNADLRERQVQVTHGGVTRKYFLVEPTPESEAEYRIASMSGIDLEIGDDGKPVGGKVSIDKFAANRLIYEPLRISLNLYTEDESGKRVRVPKHVVSSWPSRVLQRLGAILDDLSKEEIDPK
ncbi:MAG: hypothetical protein QXZ57_07205 [Nitrososphaerota archaeon]